MNGSTPVADITILPCQVINNSSYKPFSNLGHHNNLSHSQPIEVVKVTPFGSTCAYESVNETTALAPFRDHESRHDQNLTTRSIESEILAHIGQTVFYLYQTLWYGEDGFPVQANVWAEKAVFYLALSELVIAGILADWEGPLHEEFRDRWFNRGEGFDSGFYVLGHLLVRIVIQIVQAGRIVFSPSTWMEILAVLLTPLQEMGAYDNVWARYGEIYGPGNETESGGDAEERVAVARWQIWIGTNDELWAGKIRKQKY